MIEWILTDNHFIYLNLALCVVAAISAVSAIVLSLDAIESNLKYETRQRLAMIFASLFVASIGLPFFISGRITIENVAEGDWVQIYSNDQKADISIYFSPTSYIKAGEKLDNYQLSKLTALYSRSDVTNVTVVASKDEDEERRIVVLDGRNISIPREIPLDKDYYSSMKIAKIEYQKIIGQRKTLFGHTGNVSSTHLDGQIKITVDGEKSDDSLKELFDGKKQ